MIWRYVPVSYKKAVSTTQVETAFLSGSDQSWLSVSAGWSRLAV
jgi:hypothetical protein